MRLLVLQYRSWNSGETLMKKWIGILSILLFFAAFANADTLTLVSTSYGVNGPYSMSLNGSSTTTPMICYSESNSITYGEKWTVQAFTISTVSTIASFSNIDPKFALSVFQYNMLGYLADKLFANPGNSALQNAIWSITAGTGTLTDSLYKEAFDAVTAGFQTTDTFYIPIGSFSSANGYPYGTPQPFIVQTPEPGSMLLLGAGLLGIAQFRKRKLAM